MSFQVGIGSLGGTLYPFANYATTPFYTSENIKKPRFSGVFRGYKMGILDRNGLIERLKTI